VGKTKTTPGWWSCTSWVSGRPFSFCSVVSYYEESTFPSLLSGRGLRQVQARRWSPPSFTFLKAVELERPGRSPLFAAPWASGERNVGVTPEAAGDGVSTWAAAPLKAARAKCLSALSGGGVAGGNGLDGCRRGFPLGTERSCSCVEWRRCARRGNGGGAAPLEGRLQKSHRAAGSGYLLLWVRWCWAGDKVSPHYGAWAMAFRRILSLARPACVCGGRMSVGATNRASATTAALQRLAITLWR